MKFFPMVALCLITAFGTAVIVGTSSNSRAPLQVYGVSAPEPTPTKRADRLVQATAPENPQCWPALAKLATLNAEAPIPTHKAPAARVTRADTRPARIAAKPQQCRSRSYWSPRDGYCKLR